MMKLGLISNELLDPHVNWTTLSPPLYAAMSERHGVEVVRPPRLRIENFRTWGSIAHQMRSLDAVFWMQVCARPERAVHAAAYLRPRARRTAFVIDAWGDSINRIGVLAGLQRLNPCFVAFREGVRALRDRFPRGNFEWMPFGIDTEVFKPAGDERPIFAFWMGRRYDPLHKALLAYCETRGLRYEYRKGGMFFTATELGALAGQSRYFVVTPPDLDQLERTGGFSPLVMRYMEGLSAGARLLGVLPKSGEYELLLDRNAICEVNPDGSDLAEKLDADQQEADFDVIRRACSYVRREHSWAKRGEQIYQHLIAGKMLEFENWKTGEAMQMEVSSSVVAT